jgi:hypothetical protein
MVQRWLAVAFTVVSVGCAVLPRSAILGQTAAPVGAGGAEVAASSGLAYQIDNQPPTMSGTTSTTNSTAAFWAPGFEGNAQVGFTDWLGLNVHLSEAGLQPGIKLNILSGNFNLAVLPEFAIGYASLAASTTVTTGSTSNTTNGNTMYYFSFLVGGKILFSHSVGLYGGIGYDYQSLTTSTVDNTGTNRGNASQQANVISAALGWSFQFGSFALRPELAMLILPANTNASGVGNTSTSLGGGSSFLFFPNLTFAVATGKHAAAASGAPAESRQPEGMKPEELSLPPMMRAP